MPILKMANPSGDKEGDQAHEMLFGSFMVNSIYKIY